MTGAQLVVAALKQQGIKTVFGYPGGAIMPIYDALYDGGVEHILCRHEQGAAMAAIGMARSTQKVAVCMATSGPGATNLVTGLADAFLDSVPLVAITGQVASSHIGTDAFQEMDVIGMSLSCTKHSYLVTDINELAPTLAEAFEVAQTGLSRPRAGGHSQRRTARQSAGLRFAKLYSTRHATRGCNTSGECASLTCTKQTPCIVCGWRCTTGECHRHSA